MLTIRLTRVGKKNSPAYRVVVADKKRAVKGKFLEILGHYNPTLKPKVLKIDKERALFWMGTGAKPSDTVNNLMVDLGILTKKDKVNKVYGKKFSKKAIREGLDKEPEKIETPAVEESTTEETIEATVEPEQTTETTEENTNTEPAAEEAKESEEKTEE